MAQPVISYPGAKWRFYPYMVDYFPLDMKTFIEPFFGGGSVTLSVADDPRFSNIERMIGGDLYTEMWAFWNGVKDHPEETIEIATKWFKEACPHQFQLRDANFSAELMRKYTEGEFKGWETSDVISDDDKKIIRDKIKLCEIAIDEGIKFWKWTQSVDTNNMSIAERAARMILVNKISFSGMGDSGSLSKDQFCDFTFDKLNEVRNTSKILKDKDVKIYNVSFEETMKYAKDDPTYSFVFLDPPYAKQESSGLYGRHGDTHHGFPHEKFAEETKKLPCKWFITYDDSTYVRKLFQGNTAFGDAIRIKPFTIPGGYTLAGKTAEDALAGEEVFISNYCLETVNCDDGELDF